MPSKNEILQMIASAEDRRNRAREAGLSNLATVNAHYERARQIAHTDGPQQLQQLWEQEKSRLTQALDDFDTPSMGSEVTRMLTRSWSDDFWMMKDGRGSYKPHFQGLAPGAVRVGDLIIDQIREAEIIPAMVPLRALSAKVVDHKPGHIALITNDQEARKAAVSCLQSIAVRAVATFPVRKLRGIFIDPVGMGNNFPFKNFPEFISGPKTFTRSDEIREQLRSLTVHIEQVIQKYLSSDYETIEAFNEAKSFIKEPYRYLFIADFPSGFDNASLEDLKSLLTNGARAGVYVVIHIDETLEKPRNFDYSVFESYCTVIKSTGATIGDSAAKPILRPKKQYDVLLKQFSASDDEIDDDEEYEDVDDEYEDELNDSDDEELASIIAEVIGTEFDEVWNTILDAYHQDVYLARGVEENIAKTLQEELSDFDVEIELILVQSSESQFTNPTTSNEKLKESYGNNPVFALKLPGGQQLRTILDAAPASDQVGRIAEEISQAIKRVKVETVPFAELQPHQEDIWSFQSAEEIRAPIGVSGALDHIEFWMGHNEDGKIASQALLAGKPGAGKSYTLHAIIANLAMRYSPDELEMYLLDFKEGVEFQIYVDPKRSETDNPYEDLDERLALAHAKVISIDSDREFGLSVLKRIQQELEERGRQFRAAGVQSLKDFREKQPNARMPRVLVVVDEFQYMFLKNDEVTRELNVIFEDITRRGRAFGIHLLLATQSPNVANMSRGIYSFIDLRMAMQMDKPTAAAVLAEGNIDSVDLIERPGEIIYNANGGTKGHNVFGQVVDMTLEVRKKALLDIHSISRERSHERREPLVLFNGLQATRLKRNPQLEQLTNMTTWLSLRDLNKQVISDPDWMADEYPGVAWLGEAMRIGNHTHAIFRRRSRSNMLLVGASEETVFGVLGGVLISLIHCYQPGKAEFQIVDLSQVDEDSPWASMTLAFRDEFGSLFPTHVGKRTADSENNVSRYQTILQNVAKEFERRKSLRDENPDATNFGPSIFFVAAIGGLNRAQSLRPVMGTRNEQASEDGQLLVKLVSQGPELGIHSVLWFDNMKSFTKLTGEDRSWLTHFDLRVGLTMPADDSRLLLRETDAQELPRLRALFRDEAATAGLEKFKPYAVPTTQEIAGYGVRLKKRQ